MAFTFTDENVKEIIASGKPVIVDFWATWCGPCIGMSPIIEALADDYKDQVVIGKFNIDENPDFPTENRIMSIPTILFFKDGDKVGRLSGSQSRETIEGKIRELFGL